MTPRHRVPEAIQSVADKSVVFLKMPGGFLAQPVTVGRSDGKRVEIIEGLKPGALHAPPQFRPQIRNGQVVRGTHALRTITTHV